MRERNTCFMAQRDGVFLADVTDPGGMRRSRMCVAWHAVAPSERQPEPQLEPELKLELRTLELAKLGALLDIISYQEGRTVVWWSNGWLEGSRWPRTSESSFTRQSARTPESRPVSACLPDSRMV